MPEVTPTIADENKWASSTVTTPRSSEQTPVLDALEDREAFPE